MNIIKVKKLRKTFTTYKRDEGLGSAFLSLFKREKVVNEAIKGISFNVKKGEVVGFLGPNGAGKSTTLKILTGIMYPDDGIVSCLGFIPWKQRKKYVSNIGAVFGQKSQLNWDLPPIDAFYLNKYIYNISDEKFENQLRKLSELLKIEEIMKRPTRQLSLGERMKCEFVIAMLHSPTVVFLDEPTIGLDVFAKETIRDFIKLMNEKDNVTFIVTSHDLDDINHLCERLIIINHGEIVYDDSVKKLNLSRKKQIKVTYNNQIKESEIKADGFKYIILSKYQVMYEMDLKTMPLDKAISKLRFGKSIQDLEVSGIPISDAIKEIYRK